MSIIEETAPAPVDSPQKSNLPKGNWRNTTYGEPQLAHFYETPLLLSKLGTGLGYLHAKDSSTCYDEDDIIQNIRGCFNIKKADEFTQSLLPKGQYLDEVYNPIWAKADNMLNSEDSMMNIPCIPDINGVLRQINDEQLIYLHATTNTSSEGSSSCFALSSEDITLENNLFTGIPHENDYSLKIGKRNNFDFDPPEGSWFKSAEDDFYTFKFFGINMIVASLYTGDSYKTAISCYNEGDELSNDHGYFKFSKIGDLTAETLPDGKWLDTAYNIVWAYSSRMCNRGRVKTHNNQWVNTEDNQLIYLSYFKEHSSMNTKSLFTYSDVNLE